MCPLKSFALILMFVIICLDVCESQDCDNNLKTITVGQSGKENFKTIQSAIDSLSEGNSQWIHIQISPGIYREEVSIPTNKPCIYLEGAGNNLTSIEWDGTLQYATFISKANYTIAKGITFTNTYNSPKILGVNNIIQARAARINADKCVFLDCAFYGVQDTLCDDYGRHYYKNCYIQGATDFIYGQGQSLFEDSTIYFSWGKHGSTMDGTFTANERDTPNDSSGFVFKNCNISGTGAKAQLGRSLGPYARVIVVDSYLSDVVRPEGWSSWKYDGHEENLTFVEEGCRGPGANTSNRVKWMKHLSEQELDKFKSISFIDEEGWIPKLPSTIFNSIKA